MGVPSNQPANFPTRHSACLALLAIGMFRKLRHAECQLPWHLLAHGAVVLSISPIQLKPTVSLVGRSDYVSGLKNDMVVECHCRDGSLSNKILRSNKQFKGHYRCQWKFGQANLRDKQEIKWDWHSYPKVRATCLHHQTAHVLFISFYHRLSIHPPEK